MTWRMAAPHINSGTELALVIFGLCAQFMFTARFVVQWIASLRARSSVVPIAFWNFSLFGGVMLLPYELYRKDPVFVLGQTLGVVIYSCNLWLIHAKPKG